MKPAAAAAAIASLSWFDREQLSCSLSDSALTQLLSVVLYEARRRRLAVTDELEDALDSLSASPGGVLADDVAARYFTMAGRCSAIPECCIAAFIATMSTPGGVGAADPGGKGVRYARCAACVASGRVIEVRRCPSGAWCACADLKGLLFELPNRAAQLAWIDFVEPLLVSAR